MTVSVSGLTKTFAGAPALDDVHLDVEPGEIHALLGPNGAGKSTLIGCLSGAVTPDAGRIVIDGQAFARFTSRQALDAGIAVIYQHLSVVGPLPVADNIFLGSELRRGPLIRHRLQRQHAKALIDELLVDLAVDPAEPVERLPLAAQQVVEIAKALHRGTVRLLVLDEPTAALSDAEAEALAGRLRILRDQGMHIVYTTHLLGEVFALADRVTVLRDGRVVMAGVPVAETNPAEVIGAITGGRRPPRTEQAQRLGDPVLELDHFAGERFGPLTASIRGGEIVALYGPLGAGRTEALETIAGLRRAQGGQLRIRGRSRRHRRPADAIAAGVALVPGDRLRQALFGPMTSLDNLLLPSLRRLGRHGVRRRARERAAFGASAERLDVRPRRPALAARSLSGGNQQKLVVGRWLEALEDLNVLLLDEPTQGVDIGARGEIYGIMRATVAGGKSAIVMASSDPEEIVAVADRAIVLVRGLVVGELRGPELSESALLALTHDQEPRVGDAHDTALGV